jgi:hypothetical protein
VKLGLYGINFGVCTKPDDVVRASGERRKRRASRRVLLVGASSWASASGI